MKFYSITLSILVWVSLSTALIIPKLYDTKTNQIEENRGSTETILSVFANEMLKTELQHGAVLAPFFPCSVAANSIPHRYIVVFKEMVTPEEISFHKHVISEVHSQLVAKLDASDSFFTSILNSHREFGVASISQSGGIQESFGISDSLNGYIGYFTDDMLGFIRMNPLVKFVEADSLVFATDFETQIGAPWGLSRISHREGLGLDTFNKYMYDDTAGDGVTVYVIDTGININHEDFEGRAHWGKTIPLDDPDVDGNGHGTHCAGTIASKHYGVAKKANVVAVKVLKSNGSGTTSDVLKGVEFVTMSHYKASRRRKRGFKGSVANMSLGGGKSPSLDMAVNAAVDAGVHFAVAAGNENQNACNGSPASAENAITVGASTLGDARAYFSNWGKCVDVFAPGLNILSTYIGSNNATATLSGTSMASPHVAGLLAYFLSLQPSYDSEFFHLGKITPFYLKKKLIDYGTKDILTDLVEETPNILVYNGGGRNLSDFWNTPDSNGYQLKDYTLDSQKDELIHEIADILDQLNIL